MKTNNKIDKSFVYKTCQTPIHKKCLGLRLSEICDIKKSKTETHWECQTCMSDKFPFRPLLVENLVNVIFYMIFLMSYAAIINYYFGKKKFSN